MGDTLVRLTATPSACAQVYSFNRHAIGVRAGQSVTWWTISP
jgi:hypothetical protein